MVRAGRRQRARVSAGDHAPVAAQRPATLRQVSGLEPEVDEAGVDDPVPTHRVGVTERRAPVEVLQVAVVTLLAQRGVGVAVAAGLVAQAVRAAAVPALQPAVVADLGHVGDSVPARLVAVALGRAAVAALGVLVVADLGRDHREVDPVDPVPILAAVGGRVLHIAPRQRVLAGGQRHARHRPGRARPRDLDRAVHQELEHVPAGAGPAHREAHVPRLEGRGERHAAGAPGQPRVGRRQRRRAVVRHLIRQRPARPWRRRRPGHVAEAAFEVEGQVEHVERAVATRAGQLAGRRAPVPVDVVGVVAPLADVDDPVTAALVALAVPRAAITGEHAAVVTDLAVVEEAVPARLVAGAEAVAAVAALGVRVVAGLDVWDRDRVEVVPVLTGGGVDVLGVGPLEDVRAGGHREAERRPVEVGVGEDLGPVDAEPKQVAAVLARPARGEADVAVGGGVGQRERRGRVVRHVGGARRPRALEDRGVGDHPAVHVEVGPDPVLEVEGLGVHVDVAVAAGQARRGAAHVVGALARDLVTGVDGALDLIVAVHRRPGHALAAGAQVASGAPVAVAADHVVVQHRPRRGAQPRVADEARVRGVGLAVEPRHAVDDAVRGAGPLDAAAGEALHVGDARRPGVQERPRVGQRVDVQAVEARRDDAEGRPRGRDPPHLAVEAPDHPLRAGPGRAPHRAGAEHVDRVVERRPVRGQALHVAAVPAREPLRPVPGQGAHGEVEDHEAHGTARRARGVEELDLALLPAHDPVGAVPAGGLDVRAPDRGVAAQALVLRVEPAHLAVVAGDQPLGAAPRRRVEVLPGRRGDHTRGAVGVEEARAAAVPGEPELAVAPRRLVHAVPGGQRLIEGLGQRGEGGVEELHVVAAGDHEALAAPRRGLDRAGAQHELVGHPGAAVGLDALHPAGLARHEEAVGRRADAVGVVALERGVHRADGAVVGDPEEPARLAGERPAVAAGRDRVPGVAVGLDVVAVGDRHPGGGHALEPPARAGHQILAPVVGRAVDRGPADGRQGVGQGVAEGVEALDAPALPADQVFAAAPRHGVQRPVVPDAQVIEGGAVDGHALVPA